jgi:hypothetical protein
MGKQRRHAKHPTMWVATQDLPRTAGHPPEITLDSFSSGLSEQSHPLLRMPPLRA